MEFVIGELTKPAQRVKILLVDDDEFIHEVMKLFLANTQYSLVSALNVQDAITLIETELPDILITDAMMPGESGYTLIEWMKARSAFADIPVILWTIMERPDGSVMDATGKADISINKPFYRCDMMEGLEKARNLIERRTAAPEITFQI
jgi:two-component system alkaline phosphatase synthesis response regulator PhoP